VSTRTDAAATLRGAVGDALRPVTDRLAAQSARLVALGGVAVALWGFLSVLHELLVITGEPTHLYYVVAGAGLAGTALARVIRPRTALGLGAAAIVGGTYLYVQSLPGGVEFLSLVAPMVTDAVELLAGLSVLRIVNADIWALTAAPGPVFLAWYLGLRRHYTAAAAVAGGALGVLVLTGDAPTAATLVGALGVTVAVAFGDCDRRDEPLRNADAVVVLLATMVVLTLFVGVVPGAANSLISADGFGDDGATIESSLVHAGESIAVTGPVELSPEVRYTVEADRGAYWRAGTYDRYTGGGWVRSGGLRSYRGPLQGPPGESRRLQQRYTAETEIATLPAANKPTSVSSVPVPVQVTDAGGFQPASPLQEGESYRATSEVPTAGSQALRNAGTDYPDGIEGRYTNLPDDVPARVEERTSRLTANAENPYDTARVIEQWLENNYEYSLDVERPRGDIADSFLFEMEAGYCTYFATTMVTMLRTQDIPARFVVGYTPGQQVDGDEWVVRGYDSHAWVEVYFPDHGWVTFDPTPANPREAAEQEQLNDARANGTDGVDTNDSRRSTVAPVTPATPGGDGPPGDGPDGSETTPPGSAPGGDGGDGFSLPAIPLPTPGQVGVTVLVIAGLVAAGRRTGINERLYRAVWLRRLPDGDPEDVVAGAYRRVVYLRERAGRRKAPGETPREFLAEADNRAKRVGDLYERAVYGPGVDEGGAAEAAELVAELLEERSRLPHRLEKRDTKSR
jgi:transglutaminase-like putative cysteine protease